MAFDPVVLFDMDTRPLQRAARRLAVETGRAWGDELVDQMRLILEKVVKITPPGSRLRGEGVVQKKRIGESAIRADLSRAFVGVRLKRTRPEKHPDVRAIYMARRHLIRGARKRRSAFGEKFWVDDRKLKRLQRELARKVGMLAANWTPALRRLGSKRAVPAFIRRHPARGGGVVLDVEGPRKVVRAFNNVGGGPDVPRLTRDTQRRVDYIVHGQARAAEKRLRYVMRQAARRSGWQVTGR